MTTTTISITEAQVVTAVGQFLQSVLPTGTEVIRTQGNGVPMPKGAFVAMTFSASRRLSTNVAAYTSGAPGSKAVQMLTEFPIQLDFYGPQAGDWANTVQALWRDEFATDAFPDGIVPAYADDPIQIPLVTGEQTWLERWKLSAVLQISPVVTVSQESATALQIDLIEVDTHFPPTP
jgi:hypothetical protein